MAFYEALKKALTIVKNKPLILLPKLFLVFINTLLYILLARLIILSSVLAKISKKIQLNGKLLPSEIAVINQFSALAIALLILLIISFVADIYTSILFPIIVKNLLKEDSLKLLEALKKAKKLFLRVLVPSTILIIISATAGFLLSFFTNYFLTFGFLGFLMLSALSTVFIILIFSYFYYVLPVAVIEKNSLKELFLRNFRLFEKSKKDTLAGSTFQFLSFCFNLIFSIISLENALALLLFIVLRTFYGIFITISYLINSFLYFEVRENEKILYNLRK